jgi:hypothetical protein
MKISQGLAEALTPALTGLALACLVVGCSKPNHPEVLTFDAAEVTSRAMAQLDSNQDGQLDKDELKQQSPGLYKSRKLVDANRDGSLGKDELQRRLQTYIDEQLAIVPQPISIRSGGRPLAGATVELVPEEFMAEIVEPATGETDGEGIAYPSIELDEEITKWGSGGFRSGVYRVKVSKKNAAGEETIPKKYNVETILGIEVKMEEHFRMIVLNLSGS